MPKNHKKSRVTNNSSSGTALLLCFAIASAGVSLAIRQIILEHRLVNSIQVNNAKDSLSGSYTSDGLKLTLAPSRLATLTKGSTQLEGSWSGDSNGTIIITLQNHPYAFTYNSSDNSLRLVSAADTVWASNNITLSKQN